MPLDILGPASALNAVTVRPPETRVFGPDDTFFQPCSSPTALDGTAVQAVWLNSMLQQLRRAIRGMGVTEDNSDDMLLKAIQGAASGLLPIADAVALLPIHAMVGSAGQINATTSTGSLVVSTGQSIIHRGVRSYDLGLISLANRTFTTIASQTYHLRWYAPGTGRATPASSWPAGRLFLESLGDGSYNPTAAADGNTAFDTTYDSVLLARIVTSGANVLSWTSLLNKPVLNANLAAAGNGTIWNSGGSNDGARYQGSCTHNWGRMPAVPVVSGYAASTGTGSVNGLCNAITIISRDRYGMTAKVETDYLADLTGNLIQGALTFNLIG